MKSCFSREIISYSKFFVLFVVSGGCVICFRIFRGGGRPSAAWHRPSVNVMKIET